MVPGEQFPLTRDRSYVFMAVGHVSETQGVLKPTLLQLTPLASPGYGKVQFYLDGKRVLYIRGGGG